MLCRSGISFDPIQEDTRYTFEVAGLQNGVLTMVDDQTGSIWQHFDGAAVSGPAADEVTLDILPSSQQRWGQWKEDHPDTLVLDEYAEYAETYAEFNESDQGLASDAILSLSQDDRLPAEALVVGVQIGESFVAYPLADAAEVTVTIDEVAGIEILVYEDPAQNFGIAFETSVDGERLVFAVDGAELVSDDGTIWDRTTGAARSGPQAGGQLTYVTSFVSEWYGWAGYHPETTIHGDDREAPSGGEGASPSGGPPAGLDLNAFQGLFQCLADRGYDVDPDVEVDLSFLAGGDPATALFGDAADLDDPGDLADVGSCVEELGLTIPFLERRGGG